MITTEKVKELREQTGVSIMQCKKALDEAKGDMQKATVILQKKGSQIAAKKADRDLGSGVIQSYIHSTKDVGTIVVLSCETDFVAKNEEFVQLAYDLAMHVAAARPVFKSRENVDEKAMKAAREVFEKDVQDKPKELKEQILKGKLDSYFKDKILLEQSFIKDPDKTVQDLLDQAVQKFGERIEIAQYARYSIRD